MEGTYRYFAFISYSSKDSQYAEELQEFLQEFKLPTIIREEYNLPETLSPIFRDVTDLPIEELQKILRQELERSRFLIIICTPNSAVSQWVNREAEYFIELGRYDRIIPYIISGVPGGGRNECFPAILRKPPEYWPNPHLDLSIDKDRVTNQRIQNNLKAELADKEQLNGVSLDKEGSAHAHFRVLAKMLGLEPRVLFEMDEIAEEIKIDRARRAAERAEKQRRFWKRVWASAVCVISILSLTVLALFFNRNTIPPEPPIETHYYADYIERWGVPEGIFPLTEEQVKHRGASWCITSRGGIVQSVTCIGPNKQLTSPGNSEYIERYAKIVYDYTSSFPRKFPHSKCYNEKEILLAQRKNEPIGNNRSVIEFQKSKTFETKSHDRSQESTAISTKPTNDQTVSAQELFANLGQGSQESTAISTKPTNDQAVSAQDLFTNLGQGSQGSIAISTKPTNDQAVSAQDLFANLGQGSPIVATSPITESRKRLGSGWDVDVEIASPVVSYGVSYDSNGAEHVRIFYDLDGKSVMDTDGTYGREYSYDEMGRIQSIECLDEQGKICNNKTGYAVKCYTYDKTYDQLGGIQSIECKNTDGTYRRSELGISKEENVFDKWGNHLEEHYYNLNSNGELVLSNSDQGYAIIRAKYERGYRVETAFFSVDDKPCLHKDGYAKVTVKYDERGNCEEQSYFGAEGHLNNVGL